MQYEGYRFPSSARPIMEAVEEWVATRGVTLGITNDGSNEHLIAACDVKWVIGNLPAADDFTDPYTYQTFDQANVGACQRPETGWNADSTDTQYDVQVPRPEQVEQLPCPAPLDWVGTYRNALSEREVLPFWYANDETHTLYFVSQSHLPYMQVDIVIGMLDRMLGNLGDPEERALKAHERAMATLVKYFSDGASADLVNLRDEIGNHMRQLTSSERAVLQARTELRDKQTRLDLLLKQTGAHDAAQAAADAFEALGHHSQIVSVKFAGHTLTVETVGLDIEHPTTGHTAYLGQFTVTLDIQSGKVTLKNNDNARNGYDHPHVFIGSPCFGDMDNTIMELTRAGQLLGAVEMIFVFLSSVNIRDDWGRSCSYWLEGNTPRPLDVEPAAVEQLVSA